MNISKQKTIGLGGILKSVYIHKKPQKPMTVICVGTCSFF